MRTGTELVLFGTADTEPGVVPFGSQTHRHLVERAEQGVVRGRVHQLGVAVADTGPQGRQQVRTMRHRLHPAGDDDVELAAGDVGVGQRDRVQA